MFMRSVNPICAFCENFIFHPFACFGIGWEGDGGICLLNDLLLVLALVTDAFLACFAYGAGKIRIPWSSALLIGGIGTGVLLLSLLTAAPFQKILPATFCQSLGSWLIFCIGLLSAFQNAVKDLLRKNRRARRRLRFHWAGISFAVTVYLDETKADADHSQTLSLREAATLGAVLSLDSFGIGFGCGFLDHHILFLTASSLLLHLLSIRLGCLLGERAAGKLPAGCSSFGGILLMILALIRM